MALMPDNPKQQQALMAITVSLVALYFGNSLWYSGAKEVVETEEARVENMESQNRAAQALAIRAGQDTEERMAEYERHITQLEQLIPEGSEIPALLVQLSEVAREVGVDMPLMRPQPVIPGPFYSEQTIDLEVIGEFHDVGRFLSSVASLPRIVTPSDVQIEPFRDQTGTMRYESPVQATFRIKTYIVADRSGGTP
jgi:type IV pilus assembly protein PilO